MQLHPSSHHFLIISLTIAGSRGMNRGQANLVDGFARRNAMTFSLYGGISAPSRKSPVNARARFTLVMDAASLKSFRRTALDGAALHRGETREAWQRWSGAIRDTTRETSADDRRNASAHEKRETGHEFLRP